MGTTIKCVMSNEECKESQWRTGRSANIRRHRYRCRAAHGLKVGTFDISSHSTVLKSLLSKLLIQPGTLARVWLRSMQFYRGHVPIARLIILGGLRDKFVRFLGLFAIVLFIAG
jgi:hypothetical protein